MAKHFMLCPNIRIDAYVDRRDHSFKDLDNVMAKHLPYTCNSYHSNTVYLYHSSVEGSLGYHENVFRALCSLKTRDQSSYQSAVERATAGLTHLLAHVSLESVQRIYPLVTSLRGLQEISNVAPFILR